MIRDCQHPRARHQHGTRNAYILDKCRCRPCTDACAAYERARTRRVIRETYHPDESRMVDAEPVRAHVRALSAQGMGWKRVARAANVANGTLYPILYGKHSPDPRECRPPRKRISRDIADRILAVHPVLADGARTDATGTRRRLQALVAVGYSRAWLAEQIGVTPSNATALFAGHRQQVLARTAKAVAELYERSWSTPGQRSRARNDALRLGWAPPLAWDDDTIDDPDVGPFGLAPEPHPITVAHMRGMTAADIARAFNVSTVTVSKRLTAAGITLRDQPRVHVSVVEDWHDTWDHHLGDLSIAGARLGIDPATLNTHLLRAARDGVPVRRAVGTAA